MERDEALSLSFPAHAGALGDHQMNAEDFAGIGKVLCWVRERENWGAGGKAIRLPVSGASRWRLQPGDGWAASKGGNPWSLDFKRGGDRPFLEASNRRTVGQGSRAERPLALGANGGGKRPPWRGHVACDI